MPAAALVAPATAAALAGVAHNASAAGHTLYLVSTGGSAAFVPTNQAPAQLHPVSEVMVRTWILSLRRPPRVFSNIRRRMYVGKVGVDGLVAWLSPTSP